MDVDVLCNGSAVTHSSKLLSSLCHLMLLLGRIFSEVILAILAILAKQIHS